MFHINSNLSPTEAVRMHPELQVHPVIEEWAEAAEQFEDEYDRGHDDGYEVGINQLESNLKVNIKLIISDENICSVEEIKDMLQDLING